MSAADVAEVPRRELPTTDLAATSMSADASDVPRASVSTASGTSGVPAAGATASRVPAARAPAAVSHAERDAVQGEREDDRDAKGEEGTPERAQRPMNRRELHGASLVASFGSVKRCAARARQHLRGLVLGSDVRGPVLAVAAPLAKVEGCNRTL